MDEAAQRLKVHRATLYRWIKLKRIKPREIDGFVFVDVYEVAEIIRQPRRTRGRMLAVQKVAREKRKESASRKLPESLLGLAMKLSARINQHLDLHPLPPVEREMVAEKLERLAKGIRTGKRYV